MDFRFSDEQQLLQDNLRGFLAKHYGFEARRAALMSATGRDPAIWRRLTRDLGLLGAGLPEAVGGIGGGPVETMIVLEELGAALVVEPYLETGVIGAGLLLRAGGDVAAAMLPRLIDGEAILAFAGAEPALRDSFGVPATHAVCEGGRWRLRGHKCMVSAAPWASHWLVSARTGESGEAVSLFLVDAQTPGVSMQWVQRIDGRRAAELRFDDAVLPQTALLCAAGAALPSLQQAGDEAVAAICAEALGVLRRLLADTLDYSRERRQFGQPIASFQALQHRMVDMHLHLEMARSATLLATLSLDKPPRARAMAASAAKVTVGRACRFIGQNAVQLHGGMGMSEELALGSYFKRATAIEQEFGSVDHHLARHARLERAAAA